VSGESTHDIDLGATRVVKRFRSWDRGEPDREWRGLELLHTYAPGLAPWPIARRTDDGRPAIVMSRVPGAPVESGRLSDRRLDSRAEALELLHARVPLWEVERLRPRISSAQDEVAALREYVATATPPVDGVVVTAYAAGVEWIGSDEASRFAAAVVPQDFALADGNLANVLWDGDNCALVDFEDSGASDRAYEIADLIEHVRSWLTGALDADAVLGRLDLDTETRRRVRQARRVFALHWLILLLPGNPGHHRNPPGTVDRQAQRLLDRLG
jgi:Phosphotransferase enzyme family